ncbi:ABC transporter substrate-binding protein [Paenibacillus baekrokdamisoli]|uniref:ABC transporter substrate-binding protein n=1 Tax=Paenibacillus baekrokdamisoli TaxID=1712516 RepID=A0A3G9IIM6_9BACL|nr:sugar ABC transporter substrate-binding protein [Paenibacillus baekrokdamisoli]MBB3069189.1 multiple sugar transport system substrate-binding protein [Paenibacillus baekrokdamisoli]BBH18837.1 ABC transporter substrate-binding protein [Paenibacillus baekrokdamisoli]
MYKKASLGVLVSLMLVTSACSSSNKGNDQGTNVEKEEISFVDVSPSPDRTKYFNEIIAAFEQANPTIKVKMETVPWDQAFKKLAMQGASKTMPDVVNMYPAWLNTFVPAGYLEPLSTKYDAWPNKEKLTSFVSGITMEEQQRKVYKDIYYMPDALMSSALFVRKDWFKEANLPLPKTWDELFTASEKLTDPSKNRYGWAYRGSRAGFDQIFAYITAVTGGESYEKDGTSVLLRPEALQAFVRFTDIYKKGMAPKDSINWGYQEMVQGFTSGVTGILNQTTEVIATAKASMADDSWTVIPYPKGADGKRYIGASATWGYSVSADSKHKDASWKFIEFLSTPENNLKYSNALTMIPIFKNDDKESAQGPMQGFIDTLDDPDSYLVADLGNFPELGEFRESFMDAEVQKYLLNKQSAEQTLKILGDFLTKAQQKYMKENPDVPVPHVIKPQMK